MKEGAAEGEGGRKEKEEAENFLTWKKSTQTRSPQSLNRS